MTERRFEFELVGELELKGMAEPVRGRRLVGVRSAFAAPAERLMGRVAELEELTDVQHIEVERPGELVGIDCFYVGRLRGSEGAIWQLSAIDVYSSFAWAELVVCRQGNPTAKQASQLARRVARELKAAGWRLERVLADNGNEFKGPLFHATLERLGARVTHIHAGRPQTNGHVEALHKTILAECWRPAFARYLYPRYTGLKRELERYLVYYDFDRVHHGRLTRGRIPGRHRLRCPQDGGEMSRECRHISVTVHFKAPTRRRRREADRALPGRPPNPRSGNVIRENDASPLLRRRLGGAAERPTGLCPGGRLNPVLGT